VIYGLIYGLICASAPTTATLSLVNVTDGTVATFSVHPPATGTALVGNSAEWVVEAPLINNVQSVPGHFGVVFFDNALASTAAHAFLDGAIAYDLISMVQNGVTRPRTGQRRAQVHPPARLPTPEHLALPGPGPHVHPAAAPAGG